MSITCEPEIAEPGTDELGEGGGPSFRRVLVPIRSPADATQTLGAATSGGPAATRAQCRPPCITTLITSTPRTT